MNRIIYEEQLSEIVLTPIKILFKLFRVALKRGEIPCGNKKLREDNVNINKLSFHPALSISIIYSTLEINSKIWKYFLGQIIFLSGQMHRGSEWEKGT